MLSQGLGARAYQIALLTKETPHWGLDRRRMHEVKHGDYVLVGLTLNDQEAEKVVTFGPSPDQPEEAKAFRSFWGNKADLRRFADGAITETVVWTPSPHKLIVSSICQHLVERHFGGDVAKTLRFEQDKFMRVLPAPEGEPASPSSRAPFQAKASAFQRLTSYILELSELPLRVKAIYAASSSLRDASLGLPLPFDLATDDVFGEGIIEFESSGKWPDDLDAVEKLKVAFLLAITKTLQDDSPYRAQTGVEKDYMPGRETGFLQVLTEEGFAFRLRVATERDALLYTRSDKETRGNAAFLYKQKYLSRIAHTRTVQTLSQRFPFYSASVRLLKAWFNAHLLTSRISEEAIELIALKPFLDSAPYLPPSSPMAAFCRTLEFLATWNWRDTPLVLDVAKVSDRSRDAANTGYQNQSVVEGTQMDATVYRKLMAAFKKQRQLDPVLTHAPLFIATNNDVTGVTWTQASEPSQTGKVVASRMTALARAAFHVVSSPALSAKEKITHVFQPSLGDYNIVIHAQDPQFASRSTARAAAHKKKQAQYKNLVLSAAFPSFEELAVLTADPVAGLYADLTAKFKDTVIFFRGALDRLDGVSVVAGVWHADVSGSGSEGVPFKVNLGYNTVPLAEPKSKKQKTNGAKQEKQLVGLNKKAVLKEIELLGGDLIEIA